MILRNHWLAPQQAYHLAGKMIPWILILALGLMIYGCAQGLFFAPSDYLQGDTYRIMYVHVPCAILSLTIYTIIFCASVIYLVWRIKLADIIAISSAMLGVSYTLIALVTGAIWGKPMWGTWWVWDARLTSELILLFLYLGYMGLYKAIPNREKAAKICAVVAILGMVDIPIIHFSVEWFTTLHQKASLTPFAKTTIAKEMLYPLLITLAAFFFFYVGVLFIRIRTEILSRESHTAWVRKMFNVQSENCSKESKELYA